MAFDRANNIVGVHRVPRRAAGTGVWCVWVECTLCGFAQPPRNIGEIVPGLV
jgi:hypothetical protein